MKVRILPSSPEQPRDEQYLTSFLIDDTVAIDAGCAGFCGRPDDQARIDHVFLTHSHVDHVCSLPALVTNVDGDRDEPVVVHGHDHVLDSLRTDVFNNRLWPDLLGDAVEGSSFVRLDRIESEQTVAVDDLRITPVFVDHVVPTFGYIVEDNASAVIFCTDTGPTERIWELARQRPHLKALFLGASLPDEMRELAGIAAHLTPELFAREVAKLAVPVAVVAVHIKPRHREQVVGELEALDLDSLEIGVGGREYNF